jgi:hypothetical protein
MKSLELPQCRHRGPEFYPGRGMCRSSRVVAFQGTTAELCGTVCPYVDHEGERAADRNAAVGGDGYGVAIGTYDSLHPGKRRFGTQAVELNLAVLRGTCGPAVKILVCDDASPASSQRSYRELCEKYGAEFTTNPKRMGHSSGDMIVFHKAIEWAFRHGLQTVTKLSHRMVIDVPHWVQNDSRVLITSGFGTQAQMLANYGLEQVRTECVMMIVDRWYSVRVLEHFRPRTIPFWNETHTFNAIDRFVDPHAPYPHFLPWRRLAFRRGTDLPPTFFREMRGDADALFRALSRRHGVELSDDFSTIDSCRSLDYQ